LKERVTIKIPKELYERIQKVIEGTGYSSVTEFIVYVLRDLLSEEGLYKHPNHLEALTEEEIERIKKRLRTLGYLD